VWRKSARWLFPGGEWLTLKARADGGYCIEISMKFIFSLQRRHGFRSVSFGYLVRRWPFFPSNFEKQLKDDIIDDTSLED